MTPPSQQAEAYVSKVGTSYIDANLLVSKAKTVQELGQELSQNNIKGLIFEPTLTLADELVIDGIYKLIPEIRNLNQGAQIKASAFSNLKFLFQTNFYSYNGVFKYRVLLFLFRASSTTQRIMLFLSQVQHHRILFNCKTVTTPF